jgi:hypothetical protein
MLFYKVNAIIELRQIGFENGLRFEELLSFESVWGLKSTDDLAIIRVTLDK